tara:strand:+ start:3074 stop:3463 length:390 start_codon:yes stop_codon:yes gene_type:complete
MGQKYTRAYFIDKLKRLGIVEKAFNAVRKDGHQSDWKSITEAKDVTIYTISKDADLNASDLSNTFTAIPLQFHEAIVYKAVAMGYKDPRNLEINLAQYFDGEYLTSVKEAKKFSRSNYQTMGRITSHDF